MRFAVLLLASFLAAPVLSAQHTVPSGGQWLIEPGERSGIVRLTIRYGERRYSDNWNSQDDVPLSQLVGLSAADMRGSGVTVHFKIVRSAGTLDREGGSTTARARAISPISRIPISWPSLPSAASTRRRRGSSSR